MIQAEDEPPLICASDSAPEKHASSEAVPENAQETRSAPKIQTAAIETSAVTEPLDAQAVGTDVT